MRSMLTLPPDIRGTKSAHLCNAIILTEAWRFARTVVLFAAQPREPDVDMIFDEAGDRVVGFPCVEGDRLGLYAVPSAFDLVPGRWGLREPLAIPERAIDLSSIDLILVPGVAFTRSGARLGRGGGYYDRLLSALPSRACKIGVCFDVQIVPELPVHSHDQPVDFVATESGILSAS